MSSLRDENSGRVRHVAVIGGGITGLAAAQRLVSRSSEIQVTLFESSQRLGGIIRTEEADGFLMELGPDSFITNKPAALKLCEDIGFSDQLIPTDSGFRRSLVLRNGKPLPVPDGFMLMAPAKPWAILTTPILSWSGKLRLLSEAFISPKAGSEDESLANFVRRRFGSQTLERLVQPLVGGIYTSDPEKLSLKATMPRFLEMEQSHGSVIRATLAAEKKTNSRTDDAVSGSGARYGLFTSAAKGLSDLVLSLENWLRRIGRTTFRKGCRIEEISRNSDSGQWMLRTNPATISNSFDAVIVTLPTHAAAGLLGDPEFQSLKSLLLRIEYASSAIVVSGHRLADFAHPMDAFGLVIPAIERRRILAVSMSSRKFVNRAPEGHILLRTFVGGAMQPELLQMENDEMVSVVNQELRQIFGMSADPQFSEVMRYNQSMPQYHVGHMDLVSAIETAEAAFPGLHLSGSAYHGVGIPDSVASGQAAADQILASI